MVRPRIYSNEEMIAALIANKGMVYLAAESIGCEADTIYTRAKSEPEVASCLKTQRGKVVDTAELKLFKALEAEQPWAIKMTLSTIGKDRGYFEKTEIDQSSKGTLVITEEIVDAGHREDDPTPPSPITVPAQ